MKFGSKPTKVNINLTTNRKISAVKCENIVNNKTKHTTSQLFLALNL
ncbi:hypothetical protein VAE151_520420 [Vibrio aestuarianus]|uniref:Uncharacterized protein n=1 Tax=Vibrio aestuarianus TaxID=28171 RepID=A0ABM9FNG6_9VIBR|nr:hypothetical protein VAE032_240422 [Vibrio aestuarianus]CAH8188337.1 hypothetical protein VAE130_550426 [Vibrio aestuarianus]CAH8198390.1 hypothetical protein VAE016_350425 [Vibrio aestuarianus]CAH8200105.1 hypothetical protein VAE151_520420 [Vibrio aestuarianus]CAH8219516.1 hypothetical protein VAE063_900426 [Vibrio aestuarianus]